MLLDSASTPCFPHVLTPVFLADLPDRDLQQWVFKIKPEGRVYTVFGDFVVAIAISFGPSSTRENIKLTAGPGC